MSKVSRLKSDNTNPKEKSFLHRMCDNCDLGIVGDIKHVILQCPNTNGEMCAMYKELHAIEDDSGNIARPGHVKKLPVTWN